MNLSTSKLSSILLFSTLLFMLPPTLSCVLHMKTSFLEWTLWSLSTPLSVNLIIDPFGMMFSITVLFISANVMLFSDTYMAHDPFIKRFSFLVLAFVASMNLLIFIPHLVTLLIGWDGLGLISFLLVIYYQNSKSLAAGMITALTNRVGDALLLISIAWILNMSHWNITLMWDSSFTTIIVPCLILAGMTKSAQIPFSSWLPAAMAAPTPVSALVHSSTLVTAGVFLLFRFYNFLSSHFFFSFILLILACLTSLMAGISAMTECDMKKIIALSTLSQLGVMMMSLAIGAPMAAFFHMITHALFKALLFLCAGSLIHLFHHSQDLRFMGNVSSQVPSIASPLIIANLALCGSPFLAGFYSKDLILELTLFNPTNIIFILFFFLATGLTASYTIRFLILILWTPSLSLPLSQVTDSNKMFSIPTFNLSIGAITSGASLNWMLMDPLPESLLPPHLKFLTITVTLLGLFLAWSITSKTSTMKASLIQSPDLNSASCLMWFLVPLSTQFVLRPSLTMAHSLTKNLDQGWEELAGGQGFLASSSSLSSKLQLFQNNPPSVFLTLVIASVPLFIYAF